MVLIYRIDSRDRDHASMSNTNFTVTGLSIHAKIVRVKQIVIPNMFNNIRSTPSSDNNSTFSYNLAGAQSFVVPDGHYDIVDLLAHLNAQVGAAFLFSYNNLTKLISFENISGGDFTILPISGNSMADVLGITTTTIVSAGTTITFNNKPNLYNYSLIYVSSHKLSNNYNMQAGQFKYPVIASIGINVSYGGVIVYEVNEQHPIVFESSTPITDVDIQLINHQGQVISLPSNHHIQVLVEVE